MGIPGCTPDGGLIEQEPCFGHPDRYDADHRIDSRLSGRMLDFIAAPGWLFPLRVPVDEQHVARILQDGPADSFCEALGGFRGVPEVSELRIYRKPCEGGRVRKSPI